MEASTVRFHRSKFRRSLPTSENRFIATIARAQSAAPASLRDSCSGLEGFEDWDEESAAAAPAEPAAPAAAAPRRRSRRVSVRGGGLASDSDGDTDEDDDFALGGLQVESFQSLAGAADADAAPGGAPAAGGKRRSRGSILFMGFVGGEGVAAADAPAALPSVGEEGEADGDGGPAAPGGGAEEEEEEEDDDDDDDDDDDMDL